MTIAAWFIFGLICFSIVIGAATVASECESTATMIVTIVIAIALCAVCYCGIHWYMTNTARGQRAYKSQQSNLDGGLDRTVTVYSYDGDVIGEWTGKFDVTENDQETFFDVDGHRVIIQGGIIINEENINTPIN